MSELKILYIEDDQENQVALQQVLSNYKVNNMSVQLDCEPSFDVSIDKIKKYNIIILDVYKGEPGELGNEAGKEVLKLIQEKTFIPVLFFSGNTNSVRELRSQIVGVATKGDGGIEELKSEIQRLTLHNLPFLRENINNFIDDQ